VPDRGPVTCAGCALLCDDVTIEISPDSVRVRPECPLGVQWFSERIRRPDEAPATVGGEPTDVETALARAADLLRGARRPLLHGFDEATVEDARAAVALADRLGALVSTGAGAGAWPGAPAVPQRGASTATLGEIRDRSQVVVVWREDPEATHPRLLERLGFGDSSARSGERVLVVVDDRDTATARRAHLRLTWPSGRDLDALTSLHMLQRELPVAGLAAELCDLMERLRSVPHAAFVYGPGLTGGAGGQRRALALHEFVRALCHERHVVTLELPAAAGTRSADDVLAWQTGYGGAVDFAGGHPELVTATRPLATAEGVDVSLSIESPPTPPSELPAGVTQIALGSQPHALEADVSIRTAAAGVSAGGTAHRLDGIPLTLQAPYPGDAPTAAALLARLLDEVQG
jgi:formylmethanofuran dehydrogenase subunit B